MDNVSSSRISFYKKGDDVDMMIDEPCRTCAYSQTSTSKYPCNSCVVIHEFNAHIGAFPVS